MSTWDMFRRDSEDYNNLWQEFIYSKWDIQTAVEKSNNLRRAMQRVNRQLDRYASAAGVQLLAKIEFHEGYTKATKI